MESVSRVSSKKRNERISAVMGCAFAILLVVGFLWTVHYLLTEVRTAQNAQGVVHEQAM